MELSFSLVIPVYNRPQEIEELLQSLCRQQFDDSFEVIIVEDGSELTSEEIVNAYKEKLDIHYYFKTNSGAGLSRNYGMERAKGTYFLIFDSDCFLPEYYLQEVKNQLNSNFTDAFGGPDSAHPSFNNLQKAINYSMTSFLTTGGLRGNKKGLDKFQPRSFNMGISKKAFEKTGGFSEMKIGEDIDLTFRIWQHQFETQFIENAYVFHKRRSSIAQFYQQTHAFGEGRPLLNRKFPGTSKLSYWFPTMFIGGFVISAFLFVNDISIFLLCYMLYFLVVGVDSLIKNKKISVAFLSIVTTFVQFSGYGLGFLKGYFSN